MYLKDKNYIVQTRVNNDTIKKLEEICKKDNISLSHLLRYIIQYYLNTTK